jgi:hypothetical protein
MCTLRHASEWQALAMTERRRNPAWTVGEAKGVDANAALGLAGDVRAEALPSLEPMSMTKPASSIPWMSCTDIREWASSSEVRPLELCLQDAQHDPRQHLIMRLKGRLPC